MATPKRERMDAYEAALTVALAARVPDDDRDGPGRDLVTVSGWYRVPAMSGRPAWVRYQWVDGRCEQRQCTYDLAAVYIGDNGRLMCRACAGVSPFYSGHDLSGRPVERLDTGFVAEMAAAIGRAVACECGKVRLQLVAGPDGWPLEVRP